MTAMAVPRGLVSEAMSKLVSGVMGSSARSRLGQAGLTDENALAAPHQNDDAGDLAGGDGRPGGLVDVAKVGPGDGQRGGRCQDEDEHNGQEGSHASSHDAI